MPVRDDEAIRKSALPWYGKTVVDAYQKSREIRYREDFIELILEGYRSYLDGNLYASIIVVGEALLRIMYARIAKILQAGPLAVRHGKAMITVAPSSVYRLSDELTFFQAQRVLSHHVNSRIYEQIDAVRFLRNRAAHGDLPVLDEWDPVDLRSAEDFFKLLNDQISIPEGYRFYKGDVWVTLAIKDHPCNTLQELSANERLAVIQQLLVISITQQLFLSEE